MDQSGGITMADQPETVVLNIPDRARTDEEIYKNIILRKKTKYSKERLFQWFLFLNFAVSLIACFTIEKLGKKKFLGHVIWKWLALFLVTFTGLLFTECFTRFILPFIFLAYFLRGKVLEFVYGQKKSNQTIIWLFLVLSTWFLFFGGDSSESRIPTKVLYFVTHTLLALLIGSFLRLFKTLLLKSFTSSFRGKTYFSRIQDSIFNQFVLLTLSRPPVNSEQMVARVTQFTVVEKKNEISVVDITKLNQMKPKKVSTGIMKMLVNLISDSGLTTLSNDDEGNEIHKEITNEEEAIAAASHIFQNVARNDSTYIEEQDLTRFMRKEEVDLLFPKIDVDGTGQIHMESMTEWVVKVYKRRKALAHAVNDTKTAVKQLNELVSVFMVAIMILVWLLLIGVTTTTMLVLIGSQLALVAFMFGNTSKTLFEATIFVFVTHPYDVGDRCVIDGSEMVVKEMSILTTVFLKSDNTIVFYPNSVLSAKPISNFYRSPDMGDSLEFCVDFKTPMEKIAALTEKIKECLEKNPKHWHPKHQLVVKEIENNKKIKMALSFTHTMNFQESKEKAKRRTGLILEMKMVFEELNIGYDLLPQEVRVIDSKGNAAETSS